MFDNNKIRIGIIAEYNPFHNGHIYQIKQIKEKWPDSTIIVVMPDKYVQRGELAIASFNQRKEAAINCGVDEVYELPFLYATQAAHIFAYGAIQELKRHNIDVLVFGSETNNIDDFYLIAYTIKNNEKKYYESIRKEMKSGISFPKANQLVLEKLIGKSFQLPNDILGLEYVKVLVNENSNIKAHCFERSVGFHSNEIRENITSATNIRNMIFNNDLNYKKYTPMVFQSIPDRVENHYHEFQEKVRSKSAEELKQIKTMSEGMENLFKKNIDAKTYDEFVNKTNSKRYTSSRIKRLMLYVMLDIKE